jgi:hypothetical protein
MADRVPATISIGGTLRHAALAEFLEIVADEGLATEWDGEPFALSELPKDGPLMLVAGEVAWGQFGRLETFCRREGLAYARWSGARPGSFDAQRCVFTGEGEARRFAADEDDVIVINRYTMLLLGSYEAILAHFEAAEFRIPPLVIGRSDCRE